MKKRSFTLISYKKERLSTVCEKVFPSLARLLLGFAVIQELINRVSGVL